MTLRKEVIGEDYSSGIISESLQKVAKGAGIIFVGMIVGLLSGFVTRVVIARFYTQAEYGIFALAFGILNIIAIISSLGLNEGATRQIAFLRGKRDTKKVRGVIISTVLITLIVSIFLSVILFLSSEIISTRIFHDIRLAYVLKIVSLAVPFFTLINIFASIFRGFDEVKPKVWFYDVLRNLSFLLFLVPIFIFGLSFFKAMYAFSASIVFTCVAFLIYTIRRMPFSVKKISTPSSKSVSKELLVFSVPLLVASILNLVVGWTDTLMLGFYKTSRVVGLYNGALPIAHLIPVALTSMVFIYTPIVSGLHSRNLLEEIKRSYAILAKWVFSVTLPFFIVLILFPDIVLNFLFGSEYIVASVALQLLSLGFFVHVVLGPNGATLTALGRTKILMWTSLVGAFVNILLNILLIPLYGFIGAAIATAFSLALANVILSTKLYLLSGIHPFTKNYLKPIFTSVTLIFLIYYFVKIFFIITVWHLPFLFLFFILIYGLSLILTKSFDKEDVVMLLNIEKRIGINFTVVKRIINKFR